MLVVVIENKSYSSPCASSQSGVTDHELPSPSTCGCSSSFLLSPSPTRLMHPRMCQTSTIWWETILSCHCACVAFRLSLSMISRGTGQSISISIGNPHRWANSSKNGLYWASDSDVCLEAYAIVCSFSIILPLGQVSMKHQVSIALNPYWHPSKVIMNGVPSKQGAFKTGLEVSAFFNPRNAFLWVVVHALANLTLQSANW